MSVVSVFCKKGGVGKTTFIGYLAHYQVKQGKKVLIISIDDQNSIFQLFGQDELIFAQEDNYFEHLIAKTAELGDILIPVRENLYLIKTLNTDVLSRNLTISRAQEKEVSKIVKEYAEYFDYIFIDFPPSSSRLTETLLDISDDVLIVVGLDKLGIYGYMNTLQYFNDNNISVDKIKYVLPNGYSKVKKAPQVSLDELKLQMKETAPNAILLPPLSDKSIIRNLQERGLSVYDEVDPQTGEVIEFTKYDIKSHSEIVKTLDDLFSRIKLS
jgi:chromosome partitioning protein